MLIGIYSCESEKKYSDYKESDFYEAQGLITSVYQTADPTDLPIVKNITYKYFLSDSIPMIGREENLELAWAENGIPIVVLVHNSDKNISFYGRYGLKDNLETDEKKYINNYIDKLIEKE